MFSLAEAHTARPSRHPPGGPGIRVHKGPCTPHSRLPLPETGQTQRRDPAERALPSTPSPVPLPACRDRRRPGEVAVADEGECDSLGRCQLLLRSPEGKEPRREEFSTAPLITAQQAGSRTNAPGGHPCSGWWEMPRGLPATSRPHQAPDGTRCGHSAASPLPSSLSTTARWVRKAT